MSKKVTAYEDNDGEIYRYEYEADEANAIYELKEWAEQQGIGRGGEWSCDMVTSLMIDESQELADILTTLSNAQASRRGVEYNAL